MADSPTKQRSSGTQPPLTSLVSSKDDTLESAIASLRQELDGQAKLRDQKLETANMTIEQARELTNQHIDRLHRYNDIKDAGQILFGKLAELKGKTVKEIYQEYGVDLED